MRLPFRLAAAALAFGAVAAQAHNTWLLPATTVLAKPDWVTVDGAVSNDLFVANHFPLSLDNLQVTGPDGTAIKPENAARLKYRSVFDLNLPQPGTYRIAVVNQGAFASWKDKATGQPRRARGSAETLAREVPADAQDLAITQSLGRVETFVSVGKPTPIRPTGRGLELVSTAGATDHAKGETSEFTLLLDGQPAAGLDVNVTQGNTVYRDKLGEVSVKTDAQGRFSITWPAAGMYWLEASTRDAKTSLPQARERRLSYAATLEVLP